MVYRLSVCNLEMFKSERLRSARRALADTTTAKITASDKMSLCRACLVVLNAEEPMYDLYKEKDLATKFIGCMRVGDGLRFLGTSSDNETAPQLELRCICDSCYQLVEQFSGFQRMCEESFANFKNLLSEVNSKANQNRCGQEDISPNKISAPLTSPAQLYLHSEFESFITESPPAELTVVTSESIEDIEEVYIIEDDTAKRILGKEKVVSSTEKNVLKQPLGLRHKIECNDCGRGFYKMPLYEAHMLKHHGQQPYRCTVSKCERTYARANLLAAHLQEVHQNQRSTYPCTQPNCSKVYTALRSLNYHVRRQHGKEVETKQPRLMCEQCGKSFTRKALLTRHQWVHRSKGDYTFACSLCEQRFYTDQNLKDHYLRRHSNKTLWRCKRCVRIFGSRVALTTHMKKHLKSCSQ